MTQDNLRGIMAIVGLVQVLMGISGKFKNIGKEKKSETKNAKKTVGELTEVERDEETTSTEKNIKESKTKEGLLGEDIERLEKEIQGRPEEEVKEQKIKLEEAQKQLKEMVKTRKENEKRLSELKDAGKKKE